MESGPPMERERQHSLALLPRSCFSDLAVGRRFTDPSDVVSLPGQFLHARLAVLLARRSARFQGMAD